jgi:acetyl-CoA synthase
VIVNREFSGETPLGMKFSTLAGSIGGGLQTPGFIGVGRQYLTSGKFISADGGFHRIMWMPKDLKDALYDKLKARAEALDTPDFVEKIATEENASTPEELMEWCAKVDHPALKLAPLMG